MKPSSRPLVRSQRDQQAVRDWIDRRIASYQIQRARARADGRRFDAAIGDALVNELLDARMAFLSEPRRNDMPVV